jgi:polyferredoxin
VSRPKLAAHRLIRWAIQLALLAFFVALFLRTRYGVSPVSGDVFFRFDPLVLAVTSIAARVLVVAALPALLLVVATLVFGRFYCGFVCPLGTFFDLADALIRRRTRPGTGLRNLKYASLVFLLVGAALGASFIGFFDPLVIMERTLALVFYPAGTVVFGLFGTTRAVAVTESFVALLVFAGILALGFIAPRFWCRNLCPLGGIFAFFAKFSLFKFSFPAECRQCGICAGICPTGAISGASGHDPKSPGGLRSCPGNSPTIDSGECIDCMACRYRCPQAGIAYKVRTRPAPLDLGRRQALAALGTGVMLAPLARNLLHQRLTNRLIRPPGALPEASFLATCLRCDRCIKACPSGCLQPAILESGVNGFWTPRAVPRIGGCEKNCNLCGQACPTGAIRNLSLEEKSFAKIGTAVIDRSRCLAWERDKHCLVCDEACPYDAISAVKDPVGLGKALRPSVNADACVGCGACEARCPLQGPAAIQVFSIGEERRRTGSYMTDAKVQQRKCGRSVPEEIPSGFIQE